MRNPRNWWPAIAVLLVAPLVAATVQAVTDIGSSASFAKACSAISTLDDVPAAAQRVTDGGGNGRNYAPVMVNIATHRLNCTAALLPHNKYAPIRSRR